MRLVTDIIQMKNENGKPSISQRAAWWTSIATLATAFGFGGVAHAALEFHPHAEIIGTWIDNLTLVEDDNPAKESAYVMQANPGFSILQRGQRLNASLDYTMQNVFFLENSERNSTYHQGSLGLEGVLVRDYFFIEASGIYSQELVDPRLPSNIYNLFEVSNQTDALTARATPIFRHEFDVARVDLRYTRGIIDYKETSDTIGAIQDADTHVRSATLSSADDSARLTWEAHYESQEAKYELSPPFRFEQANGELGLLLGRGLRFIGRGGVESDPRLDVSKGGLDESTWEGGFEWISGRTSAEAFYGERFYGESYRARLSREARFARIELSYSEAPVTQAQEMLARPVSVDPLQQATFRPGSDEFSRLTSDVYLLKSASALVNITGQRTDIDVSATDYRRQYFNSTLSDEHSRGGSIDITRRISSQVSLILGASLERTELREGDQFRRLDLSLELRRRLSTRIETYASVFREKRTGTFEYVAHVASLGISGRF
jgi:hypothetical protein